MAVEPVQVGAESSPVGEPMPLRVEALPTDGNAAWNRFVQEQAGATFFHRAEWRQVLEQAFGHQGHYLQCLRGDVVVGVLPLVEVKSLLFGHSLISTPFCVYGGALGADPQVQDRLVDAAADLAEQLGVDYLELRNLQRQRPDWPCKDSMYVTFRRAIVDDDDANLKAIPRKQRAMPEGDPAQAARDGAQGPADGLDVRDRCTIGSFLHSIQHQRAQPRDTGVLAQVLFHPAAGFR